MVYVGGSRQTIGRQVERAMHNILATQAINRGAVRLIGRFRPTDKNELVKDHYSKLGFGSLPEDGGFTNWTLNLRTYAALATPIDVIDRRSP